MTLNPMKPGFSATILAIRGNGQLRQRLFDMGVVPRRQVLFERAAPLGFPVWIKPGDSQICLGKLEADLVEVSSNNAVAEE
ncbi:MAG: FeoA domain-containing protein [Deltaproteobacteria bacterium]|nr:FeoA domain-containing protein [Deltaproteobacteria bacterium]